jgi:predicted enzyme related to lactoylglutathione lyase
MTSKLTLKIRTIYFKCKEIGAQKKFYSELFNISPKQNKNSEDWVEFDFGNINFALIPLDNENWKGCNCVPVFEFLEPQIQTLKDKVVALGGKIISKDYEGIPSAYCSDIEGNEFEITSYHD